jgi:hypothetical protein
MDKFDIEIAKRNLTGMVKVDFRDGMTMHVNVSDVVLLANNRVRVGTHKCAVSRVRSIKDGSGVYALRRLLYHNEFLLP